MEDKKVCKCLYGITSISSSLNFTEVLLRKDKMWAGVKNLNFVDKAVKDFEAKCSVKLPRTKQALIDTEKEVEKFVSAEATEESIKIHVDEIGYMLLRDLDEGCS